MMYGAKPRGLNFTWNSLGQTVRSKPLPPERCLGPEIQVQPSRLRSYPIENSCERDFLINPSDPKFTSRPRYIITTTTELIKLEIRVSTNFPLYWPNILRPTLVSPKLLRLGNANTQTTSRIYLTTTVCS